MVNVNEGEGIENFEWRRNGELLRDWNNQEVVTIENIRVNDSGIYECHEQGVREERHAIFQVIVRGNQESSHLRVFV